MTFDSQGFTDRLHTFLDQNKNTATHQELTTATKEQFLRILKEAEASEQYSDQKDVIAKMREFVQSLETVDVESGAASDSQSGSVSRETTSHLPYSNLEAVLLMHMQDSELAYTSEIYAIIDEMIDEFIAKKRTNPENDVLSEV